MVLCGMMLCSLVDRCYFGMCWWYARSLLPPSLLYTNTFFYYYLEARGGKLFQNTEECNLQVAVFCLTGITVLGEHVIELMNVNQSTAFSFAAWEICPPPFLSEEEIVLLG